MFIQRRVSRAVALRLAAGVLPSVLAVGLVVGLMYYGEIGREAPRIVLVAAAALTAASIAIAWLNAAYFADRLARLARATEQASGVGGSADEFDRIERAVGTLGSALSASEAERARLNKESAASLRDQATMLARAVSDSLLQLDQVRLPLQILLESPFGELNDNQEELLRDARGAADTIDGSLRRLGQLADIDRDALAMPSQSVQLNDVVRSVLPLARAAAERRDSRVETALEPGLPRVIADRTRLAEALALIVTEAANGTAENIALAVSTARDGSRVVVRVSPMQPDPAERSPAFILATRLIQAQGGEVSTRERALEIRLGH